MNVRLRPGDKRMLVLEVLLWTGAAVGILIAGRALLVAEPAKQSRSLPLLTVESRSQTDTTDRQEQLDLADELLGRETDDEISKQAIVAATTRPPNAPSIALPTVSRLSIKGIVWLPSPHVIAEGGGLPAGGSVLRLHTPVAGIELLGIRGDSVVIKGRDSTWVLALSAKQ